MCLCRCRDFSKGHIRSFCLCVYKHFFVINMPVYQSWSKWGLLWPEIKGKFHCSKIPWSIAFFNHFRAEGIGLPYWFLLLINTFNKQLNMSYTTVYLCKWNPNTFPFLKASWEGVSIIWLHLFKSWLGWKFHLMKGGFAVIPFLDDLCLFMCDCVCSVWGHWTG